MQPTHKGFTNPMFGNSMLQASSISYAAIGIAQLPSVFLQEILSGLTSLILKQLPLSHLNLPTVWSLHAVHNLVQLQV